MKIIISHAIGLLLLFSIISCTEEIAEEVQNKEAVSSDGTIADYSSRSLKVVHKMDESLSFLMHKAGNFEAGCELSAPSAGFDATDYVYDSANYTVDCVLDVQELDLYFHGVEFELQVDDQLCEYVRYVPYSVWRFQPGSSDKTIHQIECDAACEASGAMQDACGNTYDDYNPSTYTGTNPISADDNLCKYNYDAENPNSTFAYYPNCDEGTTTTIVHSYVGDNDDDDDGTQDDPTCSVSATTPMVYTTTTSKAGCGGNGYNCLDGAALEDFDPKVFSSLITDNMELDALTITHKYAKMFGTDKYNSNMKLANFSRICSETDSQKDTALTDFSYLNLKGHQVEDIRAGDPVAYPLWQLNGSDSELTDLADNLFRGVGSSKPYYAFYCLDQAYDVKAQVRIFIREWDRKFLPTNTFLNTVSDIAHTNPLMDALFTEQSGGVPWNDVRDLDDFFHKDSNGNNSLEPSGGADFTLWRNNRCTTSQDPFSPNNFPGTEF